MRKALLVLGAACVLAVAADVASAQSGIGIQRLTPPTMNPPKEAESDLGAMGMGILILLLVVGVNFIPSKRGHKD